MTERAGESVMPGFLELRTVEEEHSFHGLNHLGLLNSDPGCIRVKFESTAKRSLLFVNTQITAALASPQRMDASLLQLIMHQLINLLALVN